MPLPAPKRVVPIPTPETEPFWQGARLGELRLQRCDACAHVSVLSQVDELSKGLVDLRRLVFDLSLVVLPLFVTTRVVDSWRWG